MRLTPRARRILMILLAAAAVACLYFGAQAIEQAVKLSLIHI